MNETEYAELRTLVEHTKDELHRAGLFDKDSDYGGMIGKAVLAIMKVFAKQGHSGFSAMWCRDLFHKLSNSETLTPITSDPEEWNDVSDMCSGKPMWQNNRNPAMFSEDGGKTWCDVNDKEKASELKERSVELIKVPLNDYDASELGNDVLGDDFRIATAWFATLKSGKDIGKTEKDIRGYMNKIVEEIVKRDKVTFNPATMKETSRDILSDTLWKLFGKGGKGIFAAPPHAQMIADGRKTLKLAQKPWDLKGFHGLLDGKDVIGMVRFEDRQEIDEEAFEKRRDEHKVTRDELEAWGWNFPLFGWKIREFVSLVKPMSFKVPKDLNQLIDLAMMKLQRYPEELRAKGIESFADVAPGKLKELTNKEMVLLDAWLHASWEYSLRGDGAERDPILNADIFVAEEKERRGMERRVETSLDFAVERFRGTQMARISDFQDACLQATGPKLTNERSKLRPANPENETERCGFCVFFQKPDGCKIVDGPVTSDLVCDWIQSRGLEEEAPTYEVSDEDWIPFGVGMIAEQPYQHIVIDVAVTPAGPMVLIQDTAETPHRFSLGKEFHIGHTSFEHHWTQEEVDELIDKGRAKLSSDAELHEIKSGRLIYLNDVMRHFKDIYLSKPHVYLVGSLPINGRGHDIDVLVRGEEDCVLEFRILKLFPPYLRKRVRFIYDPDGPFTSHLPLYALKAEKMNSEIVSMEDNIEEGDETISLQRLVKQPPMPDDAKTEIDKWKKMSRKELSEIDAKKLPQWFWIIQEHYRGKSAHDDFRVKQNGNLEGWTITGQVAGAIPDVNTLADAKKVDEKFDDPKTFKFRPSMDPAKVKVVAVRKDKQPLELLNRVSDILPKGTPGATKGEDGIFYAKDWGCLWPGAKKEDFEEYFIFGSRFDGRLIFRLVDIKEEGRGLEPGARFFTWMAKEQTPLIMTRRARVETREDIPPDGISWLPPNWEAAIPKEMRWWDDKLTDNKKLDRMDQAYNHLIDEGVLAGRKLPEV